MDGGSSFTPNAVNGVAKLAKSFGYAPSVLRVEDELTQFLRGLTKVV